MVRLQVLTTGAFDSLLAQCLKSIGILSSPYDAIKAIREAVCKEFALAGISSDVLILEKTTNTVLKISIISGQASASGMPAASMQSICVVAGCKESPHATIQLAPACSTSDNNESLT